LKLADIKSFMIEQFFAESTNGVSHDKLDGIFESLGTSLKVDLSADRLTDSQTNDSQDPSKAFKRFTEGRVAMLTIMEEDGMNKNALFAAVRYGTKVMIANLTTEMITEKTGDLAAVKSALKQAKARNDEVFFTITTMERA